MKFTNLLTDEHLAVLNKARKTYGETNQMLVSTEELCELAAVCTKYPRYNDKAKALSELHAKAVDEVADVLIVLDHIIDIMCIDFFELQDRIDGKVDRLGRWLDASDDMEQTTVDRVVRPSYCSECRSNGKPVTVQPCVGCHQTENGSTGTNFQQKIKCGGCIHFGKFKDLVPICGPCVENNGANYDDGTWPNEA